MKGPQILHGELMLKSGGDPV
jgi:ribosomal protein L30/L7E